MVAALTPNYFVHNEVPELVFYENQTTSHPTKKHTQLNYRIAQTVLSTVQNGDFRWRIENSKFDAVQCHDHW